ncbi:MAG: hypothetical protein ACLSWD_08625 [Clostridium sp.]
MEIIHHAINSVFMVQIPLKKYIDDKFKKDLYYDFDYYGEYGGTDPFEAIKQYYSKLPISNRLIEVHIYSGAQYVALVQKANELYGSAIIFSYSGNVIARLINGTWSKRDI